jgi:hypothetical protein
MRSVAYGTGEAEMCCAACMGRECVVFMKKNKRENSN